MTSASAERPRSSRASLADERGQATILGLGIACGAVALGLVLLAVAQVYLQRANLQQAADIAAASLASTPGDAPQQRARALALANGAKRVEIHASDAAGNEVVVVSAPVRAIPGLFGGAMLSARAIVQAPAQALVATGAMPAAGSAGGGAGEYHGPLVAVDAAVICPRVGTAYRTMQVAAAASGIRLYAVSGYRSYAEQAVLYARLGPGIAAPPGRSLHHQATEFDLAVGSAGSPVHQWLTTHAGGYGFIQRYSWEPWHWGNVLGC